MNCFICSPGPWPINYVCAACEKALTLDNLPGGNRHVEELANAETAGPVPNCGPDADDDALDGERDSRLGVRTEGMTGYGFCQCGCGSKTTISNKSCKTKGWIKGEPLKYLRGHNIAINGIAKTERSIGNKGISSHGYVRVRTGKDVREYEHVLVAEKALGRKLKNFGKGHPKTEVVHHIDGDKQNNAHSNLLVCTHAYHTELHHRLEASENWPQFQKVIRNQKRKTP